MVRGVGPQPGEERGGTEQFYSAQTVRGKPFFTPALTCKDAFLVRLNVPSVTVRSGRGGLWCDTQAGDVWCVR